LALNAVKHAFCADKNACAAMVRLGEDPAEYASPSPESRVSEEGSRQNVVGSENDESTSPESRICGP